MIPLTAHLARGAPLSSHLNWNSVLTLSQDHSSVPSVSCGSGLFSEWSGKVSVYPETCLAAFCPLSLLRRPGMPICVVPLVPTRAQMCDTNIFGPHHQTNKELLREMKASLGIHGPSSFRNFDAKRCPQKVKAHSVSLSSPNFALHTFSDTSTKAPMPCGTGQYSFQRSSYSRKHQSPTCSKDLCVMHSSSGTVLLDGLCQQSKAPAHFYSRYGLRRLCRHLQSQWLRFPSDPLKPRLCSRQESAFVRSAAPNESLTCSTSDERGLLHLKTFPL